MSASSQVPSCASRSDVPVRRLPACTGMLAYTDHTLTCCIKQHISCNDADKSDDRHRHRARCEQLTFSLRCHFADCRESQHTVVNHCTWARSVPRRTSPEAAASAVACASWCPLSADMTAGQPPEPVCSCFATSNLAMSCICVLMHSARLTPHGLKHVAVLSSGRCQQGQGCDHAVHFR